MVMIRTIVIKKIKNCDKKEQKLKKIWKTSMGSKTPSICLMKRVIPVIVRELDAVIQQMENYMQE